MGSLKLTVELAAAVELRGFEVGGQPPERPHAMRDGPRKSEGARGQVAHVDRIHVAGDESVAAAETRGRAKAAGLHRHRIRRSVDAAIERGLGRARRRPLAREESAGFVPARLHRPRRIRCAGRIPARAPYRDGLRSSSGSPRARRPTAARAWRCGSARAPGRTASPERLRRRASQGAAASRGCVDRRWAAWLRPLLRRFPNTARDVCDRW